MARSPMVNLYAEDVERPARLHVGAGFREAFRTPAAGDPAHVELGLDGFTRGVASAGAAIAGQSSGPTTPMRRARV